MKQIFKKACDEYNSIATEVKTIGLTLEDFFAKKGKTFSAKVFVTQFDCLLQYSLLQIALADGVLEPAELAFINQITSYGDLVTYINTQYKTKITWEDFMKSSEDSIDKWISINKKYVDELMEQFTDAFAFIDAAVDKDILSVLADKFGALAALLAMIDGEISPSEKSSLRTNYIMDIVSNINAKIKRLI